MVQPGHFMLHSIIEPAFAAGDYVLRGEHEIEKGSQTEAYEGHFRITAPRFRMPPDQVLSTFPPAQEVGSFDARLPQIVLKRRTLPWEREPEQGTAGAGVPRPWLALVVIAEGEGQISGETAIADCVTPGVNLDGPNDVATGIYLEVSEGVVRKVFPTSAELGLLAHVREVDVEDTELAEGDDDGFVAVVMANRLPEFDRVNNRTVKYFACLINLEGQLDELPLRIPFSEEFNFETLDLAGNAVVAQQRTTGQTGNQRSTGGSGVFEGTSTTKHDVINDLPVSTGALSGAGLSVVDDERVRLGRDIVNQDFRVPIPAAAGRKLRFPILAHWSFTAGGAGSFESYLRNLDVGLLGTVVPPEADDLSEPPEVAETGHVGLDHQTRRGDQVRAWYRSPLSTHPTTRRFPGAGGPDDAVLAHTSDQLRIAVPDGRENLGLASAFEIGRLMALSQPDLIASLMRWRREQFGLARSRRLAAEVATTLADRLDDILDRAAVGDLGALIGNSFTEQISESATAWLGKPRPVAGPGLDIEFISGSVEEVVVDGLGLPADLLTIDSPVEVLGVLSRVQVTNGPIKVPDGGGIAGSNGGGGIGGVLDDVLRNQVDDVATAVLGAAGLVDSLGDNDQLGVGVPDDVLASLRSVQEAAVIDLRSDGSGPRDARPPGRRPRRPDGGSR